LNRLEEFAPAYQFNEFHRIRVAASRGRIYRSIKDLIDPYVDDATRIQFRREVLEA